jgi:SAM-dependent methyltransferase
MESNTAIRRLYSDEEFQPLVWRDASDHGYLGIHLIERSISLLAPVLHGRLIDVGCGQQPYRSYYDKQTQITACDFDARRGIVDFACPAHQIPVADGSFDSILCTEVLEHVPDPLAVWKEFYRILVPGGLVLLTTPLYWPPHELPYDFYRYPEQGLRHLIQASGFEVRELLPRGGNWAFLGQVHMHVMGHYFRWKWLRRWWNRGMLCLDRRRLNPRLTLGWTVLAEKLKSEPRP